MASSAAKKWLLLIHQIPPKPNALRVKIWRRLQQVGAVSIKQSVYVMPLSDMAREDLNWILKEIVAGGGDGSISEARFVKGLSDEQILALFQKARQADYEKLIQEVNTRLTDWSAEGIDPRDPLTKGSAQLSKLRRRLEEIGAIDFFQAPERNTAELLIRELSDRVSDSSTVGSLKAAPLGNLMGKTWVTRKNLFVDRIACCWLIRRFVDQAAAFKFVTDPRYTPRPDEIRFDMFEAEYTHEGDRCTFEVMIQQLRLHDRALSLMAEVIHDIDLKDEKFGQSVTDGFNALLTGLVVSQPEDDRRVTEGIRLFDNMHAYYQRQMPVSSSGS